jgi:hypothetical protein
VVTGVLTGRYTSQGHIYINALTESPLCRGSGAEEGTSALATLRHQDLGFFFWTLRLLKIRDL